jgi:hypothetical protein
LGLNLADKEEQALYEELRRHKPTDEQARNDAKQLLTIYALREKNNERSISGMFGFNTWWLTTDTASQKALETVVGKKLDFRHSPYIRADFLYNYITLAPSSHQVDNVYKSLFPTLLGVNVSYHVPRDVSSTIQRYVKEHEAIVNTPRFKGVLRQLGQDLRSDPRLWTRENVQLWLDSKKSQLGSNDESNEA